MTPGASSRSIQAVLCAHKRSHAHFEAGAQAQAVFARLVARARAARDVADCCCGADAPLAEDEPLAALLARLSALLEACRKPPLPHLAGGGGACTARSA